MKQPAAGFHERLILAVFFGLAALSPFMIVLAHRAIAPMLLLMGLAAASRGAIWREGLSRFVLHPDWTAPLTRAGLFFALFCLWAMLAGLWAPRADGFRLALNILTPALAGAAAIWEISHRPPQELAAFNKRLAFVAAAMIGLVAFEAATSGFLRLATPPVDSSPNRISDMVSLGRGATIMSIALFGALALFHRVFASRPATFILAGVAILAAIRFEIFSNVAGLLVGGLFFGAALRAPQRTQTALAAAAIAALVVAPFAALIPADALIEDFAGRAPLSWLQRLAIWRAAGEIALQCLPFGCGPDYARAVHALGRTVEIPGAPAPLPIMPIHPHSIFLQIWMELGLPGAALFAAAVWSAVAALKAAPLSPLERAAVVATAAGLLVSALVEASLWQVWRNAAPLFAGLFIAAARQQRLLSAGG